MNLAAVLRVVVFLCLTAAGCSIPSLESTECSAARDDVKKFYSFHFGNDMRPSDENLRARARFLTPDLYRTLSAAVASETDYFTASDEPPKTFKIAQCAEDGPTKADVIVQLYWREDAKVTQKELHVEAVKSGDRWLVNKVSN